MMMNNNDDVMETEKDDAMMEGLETPFDGDADAGVTADGSDDAVEKRRWPKWLVPVIVVACVVALMAGGAAWYLIDSNRRAQARGACEQGVTSVTADKAAWEKLLKADDTIAASKVTSDQVADSATVETLTDLLAETTDLKIVACDADATADLEAVTAALATTAEWYQGQTKKIDEAVAAVTSSRDAKTLATARDALVKKVDEARSLLSKSDGSVADDSTRDALGKAIDEADKGKDDKDPSMLDGLREKLVSAMQAVSDSRDAKARADEEAAAQAAAEAAAQAQAQTQTQQQYAPSYSGGGYSGGGYAPAPAPSYSGTGSGTGSAGAGGGSVGSFGGGIGTGGHATPGGVVTPDVAG